MQISPAVDTHSTSFVEKAKALRPFYFMVVVWGKRYSDLLLDYCIASLLSPNNIPALLNNGNKFLIATTEEDWAYLQDKPLFIELKRFCEPVFMAISACPPRVSHCIHMGIGHKLVTDRAFADSAYGAILTPDMMNSDGTVAAMQRLAVEGYQVMLTAALRFGEEPLFEGLRQLGVLPQQDDPGQARNPVVAHGRQFVHAGLRGLHSETLTYEWDQPFLSDFPSAIWRRVPGEDGIIVHSLSWAPMLIDYGSLRSHNSEAIEKWTIDGDYIYKNFKRDGKVYVVQDSDEVMQISWAPLADREFKLKPKRYFSRRFMGLWNKRSTLLATVSHPSMDPLKRAFFAMPVWWHADDLNSNWIAAEQDIARLITTCGLPAKSFGMSVTDVLHAPPYPPANPWARIPYLAILRFLNSGRLIKWTAYRYWLDRERVTKVVKAALRGDRDAIRRIYKSLSLFFGRFTGISTRHY